MYIGKINKILRTKFIIASLVAVVTFIVFSPSLQNEFINWDDYEYVCENSFIRSLDTQLLKSAFMEFHASNWHPLTWLSHAVDYAIWGLNPLGHHLTNNILHALNTFMVVFLVMKFLAVYKKTAAYDAVTQPFFNDRTIMITGAVTGLLFGLHPLHVESVAWVSERKDLLCAFFFLLSIMAYTRYVSGINTIATINYASRFSNKKYLFALGFFILSLLSKPMAVTLPFVLLILDWYLFRRIQSFKTFRTAFNEKLPFIVLSLISSVLTFLAQNEAVQTMSLMQVVPLQTRLVVAAKSLMAYLVKMILPLSLAPFYPYPVDISPFSLDYIVPIFFMVGITALCLAVMRKQKLWISVWSYYVVTLVPVLGIVQVGGQSMADRYTYLPSIGPFFIIGLIAAKLYEKVTALTQWRGLSIMASLFFAIAMFTSISYSTVAQIGIWKNNTSFWSYFVEKQPSNPFAHMDLGDAYLSEGLLDMAIQQYRTVLTLLPNYVEAYDNLGKAYFSKGLFDMAISAYSTVLRLKPDNPGAHNNLGMAYNAKGLFDMAKKEYQIALRLKPNYANPHFNLGALYLNEGSVEMAIKEFESGLRIRPDDYEARQIFNDIASRQH